MMSLKLTVAGKWEHATNTFVATTGAASFEIGVVACNYESELPVNREAVDKC